MKLSAGTRSTVKIVVLTMKTFVRREILQKQPLTIIPPTLLSWEEKAEWDLEQEFCVEMKTGERVEGD